MDYKNCFFHETEFVGGKADKECEAAIVNIYDDVEYQEMLGFGGAFTESAAYNYSKLSEEQKAEFIKKYFDKKEGIGYNFGRTHINSCDFLRDYLIPVLEEEGLEDLKIIIWDHNKERVYDRAKVVLGDEGVNQRVWAVGHHWYTGDHYDALSLVTERLHKPNICTEFCSGIGENALDVAECYARDMCENLNHHMVASCDWNLLLSDQGGPYHNRTAESVAVAGRVFESKSGGLYAPILFDNSKKELVYTPIYYYIGHFSKYVKRGAKRIATTKYTEDIYVCAFKNLDDSIVIIALNTTDDEVYMNLRCQTDIYPLTVKAHSIMTVLL